MTIDDKERELILDLIEATDNLLARAALHGYLARAGHGDPEAAIERLRARLMAEAGEGGS